MTLKRVWIPTSNYSSGGKKRLLVVHTMEGFTGTNGAYDCAKYFQGDVGASSHVCIDNNRGTIWEGVSAYNAAWTQCNYNSVSVSAEQSGFASWSRDYWLTNRSNELHNTADWIAEEAKRFGIPIKILTASQAQSGSAGVCQHRDLGSSGCGHTDCGDGYPIDTVIQWALGSTTPPPTPTAPPFPYPSTDYLGMPSSDPHCHSGCYPQTYPADTTNVRTWQTQMDARGWTISIDGCYGSQSKTVCSQFQSEKGLSVDGLVGPNTWKASWTAPIT